MISIISNLAKIILFCLWLPSSILLLCTYTPITLIIFMPLGVLTDLADNSQGDLKWHTTKTFFEMAIFYLQIPMLEGWFGGGNK